MPPSLSVNQMKGKVWEAFSGPGSRALPAETMRHLLFPGRVGPTGLGSPRPFAILVGATGGRPMGPPHPAEVGLSVPEKGSPGRCFLRATPLTPGHGKGYLQSAGGRGGRAAAYHEAVCRLVPDNPKSMMNGPAKSSLANFPLRLPIPQGICWVTSILSQRSLFTPFPGNIYYESIRLNPKIKRA